jgi:peptidoglycan hydrolase-like protein with peptidoglycan-binding domain
MAPSVPFPRPLYPPSHEKGPVPDGVDVVAVKRAISRAGFFPWQDFDDSYSENFAMNGVKPFQQNNGLSATGNYGEQTHNELVKTRRKGNPDQWAFDPISITLMHEAVGTDRPILPPLGPVSIGGKSVLDHDLTHATDGLLYYPAFDDVFGAGRRVIAPEPLTVTDRSRSRPGAAFFANGLSGIRYWFGHLVSSPPVGTRFPKGATMGVTCENHVGGGPHCHVAVNVEKLWGIQRQLVHHTNYTHGAPTIGTQLGLKR